VHDAFWKGVGANGSGDSNLTPPGRWWEIPFLILLIVTGLGAIVFGLWFTHVF
jgi:hypothetical protein